MSVGLSKRFSEIINNHRKNYIKTHLNLYSSMTRSMGTWSFYLTKDEEKYIKRLVAEGKYRSVYSFQKHATRSLIASLEKAKDEGKDYWWREDKK